MIPTGQVWRLPRGHPSSVGLHWGWAMEWSARAACQDAEPDVFFPIGGSGALVDEVTAAKQVCARCTVVEACLRYALDNRVVYGVWGGLDESERRALLRVPLGAGAGL